MLIPTTHLPVVDLDGNLIGFLSKEKMQLEMTDLSRGLADLELIPEEYLDRELPELLLSIFSRFPKIPVLAISGEKRDSWDKPRYLAEVTKFLAGKEIKKEEKMEDSYPGKESKSTISYPKNLKSPDGNRFSSGSQIPGSGGEPSELKSSSTIEWFSQLILSSFSDPLFATDLQGNSIFYNEAFEKNVLADSMFRNSLSFAERYFRDLNKDVFSAFLKANDLDLNRAQEQGQSLQTLLPKLGYLVKIVSITKSEKVVGYLYHFVKWTSEIRVPGKDGNLFPSLEEAFARKMPLDLILKEVESFYIHQSLLRNHKNVSHTADDLGVPRSTLQNRIKFLDLEKKFPEEAREPIPRKRAVDGQISEEALPKSSNDKKKKGESKKNKPGSADKLSIKSKPSKKKTNPLPSRKKLSPAKNKTSQETRSETKKPGLRSKNTQRNQILGKNQSGRGRVKKAKKK
jgi:hypothetical protein